MFLRAQTTQLDALLGPTRPRLAVLVALLYHYSWKVDFVKC